MRGFVRGCIRAIWVRGNPLVTQAPVRSPGPVPATSVAEREIWSINYQMNVAKFPAHDGRTGCGFDESAVSVGRIRRVFVLA